LLIGKKEEIVTAYKDCDAMIKLDPYNADAYLLRARAGMILKNDSYCEDIFKAKAMGIPDPAKMLGATCR